MTQRICLITRPDLRPTVHGAAVKIIKTAESLSRLNSIAYVLTNDRVWFYEARDGLIRRRRYPQLLLSLSNSPPALKALLARLGLPTYWHLLEHILDRLGYPRDEHFLYQPLIDVDFWLRTLYFGWAHQIDVYQAEFPGYAVPAILASRLLGGTSSLVEHNVEYERLADTIELPARDLQRLKKIELWCAQTVDRVVAVSEPDRARLVKGGVPRDKIAVIPHGVDLHSYQGVNGDGIRQRYNLPRDVPLLVFHGTLHYWPNTIAVKHIAEDILPGLEARGVPVKAMIIGMNPPRYYAHPDIVFTEVVQDLPEHLAAADIAIVPLDDGGGTRLKILEYFAAGLPVISTPKGAEGIPAEDGKDLVIAQDMNAFVDQIARLVAEPNRALEIGRQGSVFVEKYGWDRICEGYVNLYRESVPHRPLIGRERAGTRPPSPERIHPPTPGDAGGLESGSRSARTDRSAPQEDDSRRELTPAMARVIDHLPRIPHPTKPLTMIMMINRGCNLRCAFCDLYESPRRMPTASALKVIREAADLGVRTLVLTGGEPFLHPGLWEMIRQARALGMGTNVTTNGTLIEKHLDALLESGLDSVSVSLDGLKETHEALRKVKGCHEKTWTGLKLLQRHRVNTNIYFVVTGLNVHELLPVHKLARDHGFGFDFWPVNDAHELRVIEVGQQDAYRQALDTLAAQDPRVAAKRDYYLAGLEYHAGWNRHVRCLGLIEQFGINLEGDLVPCCVWENKDLGVGNVLESSLEDLWFGPEARARREEIFSRGCQNRCFNHSLYEFQLSTGLSFEVGEE